MAAETLRTAWVGLMSHRMRTALTVLGITIGIASVIVLIAVGKGSSNAVQESIDALGSNTLTVLATPGASHRRLGGGLGDARAAKTPKRSKIPTKAPAIKSVSPVLSASGTELVYESSSYEPGEFVGTTPTYAEARNYQVESGSFLTAAQVNERARVAVIGPEVASELFPGQSAVGKTIQANGKSFEVIGVTKAKGSSGTQSQDDVVMAPISAVEDTLAGYGELSSITVQAVSKEAIGEAEAQVTSILDERHGVSEGISVINQGSIIEASSSSEGVFTTLLAWVAAISLLVGGIGVMNIMLVSVTERTREIGIRKAIGARRSDILAQFLTEAVLVSAMGGAAGHRRRASSAASSRSPGCSRRWRRTRSLWPPPPRSAPASSSAPIRRRGRRACDQSRRCALSERGDNTDLEDEMTQITEPQIDERDDDALDRRRARRGVGTLPPRPRNRLLAPLPLALIAVLIAACGFLGGVLVQKGSEGGAPPPAYRAASPPFSIKEAGKDRAPKGPVALAGLPGALWRGRRRARSPASTAARSTSRTPMAAPSPCGSKTDRRSAATPTSA